MLSIIYPYRERDLDRIRFSLQSLSVQTSSAFSVHFVDYGSPQDHAKEVKALVNTFSFVSYSYLFTEQQPWNKSKALNSVIKKLDTHYFFVADIDMIFHPNFIETANQLSETNAVWYFQVGFLDEKESETYKEFNTYNTKFKSGKEATGLTMCPVKAAQSIHGFNEFYHFWGSEDTDFHKRLTHANYKVNYYDKSVLLLHQWHKIYRNKEVDSVSKVLQLSGIVRFNQNYLKHIIKNKTVIVNSNWGEVQQENDYKKLNNFSNTDRQTIGLSSLEIDYFLFQTLPNLKGEHHFVFKEQLIKKPLKRMIKNLVKEYKIKHYSLKEVNDKVLFHIINFYHYNPYSFVVSDDLGSIRFSIKK